VSADEFTEHMVLADEFSAAIARRTAPYHRVTRKKTRHNLVAPMADPDPLDFDDDTLQALTRYERRVRAEILDWRSTEGSRLQTVLDMLSTPAEWTLKRLADASAHQTVVNALHGGMELVQDASLFTVRPDRMLDKAQKHGISADTVSDLRHASLQSLDALSGRYVLPNKIAAGLEGAVLGMTGPAAALADLPVLFAIGLRAVQQIGTCYGFDMEDPDVQPLALSVFHVGAGTSSASKSALLVDVHVAAEAFARKWTYQKVAGRTTTGSAAQAVKRLTQRLPQKIAHKVTKQKLAQALPIIGAGIGGGFNYHFLSTTAQAARMTFRSLFLSRRYGPSSGSVPLSA
jgi:hypothetical protein